MAGEHIPEDLDKFYAPCVSEEHLSLYVIYRRLPQHTTVTLVGGSFLLHTESVWAGGACEVDTNATLSRIRHAPFHVCNLISEDIRMLSEKQNTFPKALKERRVDK
jgi:hypothetical protein